MSINSKRGFTLIELLVVIAIIGILASVVLASLNSARSRGADAAIKSNLANLRAQAEILYDTHGGYGVDATPTAFTVGNCANTADTLFVDPNMWAGISAAQTASGGTASCVSSTGSAGAWAVAVPLKSTPANSWCVDSSGAAKQVTPAGVDRGFNGVACK